MESNEYSFSMNQRNIDEYFQLYQENVARAIPANQSKPKKKKESTLRFFFNQVLRGIFSASISAFFNAFIQSFQPMIGGTQPAETQYLGNDIANDINSAIPNSFDI
ncbi:hypothetical protein CYY_007123 [Polysphondylium violaceum]|uniref:Uncharacterized protein n=1 Tax=Polysphondylium violaceum TaxID=133409 RepID=A0A8J4UR35_9MYCE|nr:hypothetical protein CYY_007123 [Polysphondylium violaceum]